jgi:hypothetical protein
MAARETPHRASLAVLAGFVAVSAYGGAAGLMSGWLRIDSATSSRLPWHSPVFAGIALACVVAVPATVVAVLAWRRHPRARDAAALAGLLLTGWIVVEVAVIRQFSPLQAVYGLAGLGLAAGGNRHMLAEVADVVMALPVLLTAPLYRRWHLRWGTPSGLLTMVLAEFGDFAMMRKMLLGIKSRAETCPARSQDQWPPVATRLTLASGQIPARLKVSAVG